MMSEYVIETSALSKSFGRKQALRDLSMALPRGGVHAVIGSNGAGKSTLFRILLGFLSPTSGSSRILGVESSALTPEVRGRVGLVHEEHTLPAWMKVRDLVALNRRLYSQWDDGVYREVMGHFDVHGDQKISELSRGERAGASLAMALAQGPELLILDEPTLGLDVVAKQAFLQSLLFVGGQERRTIVYCSHQMDEIERVADNLVILERGEVACLSAPEDFCERVSYWVTEGLSPRVAKSSIPGLLQAREIEEQRHLVVLDQDDSLGERLRGLGAVSVQRVPVGLDRAVNAYLTRGHHSPRR
jgi:ABC-2 type transport system ATP-binding protein